MQIINDPYRTFAGGMAASLNTGLQNLANLKMQELLQRKKSNDVMNGLRALNINKEKASALAPLIQMYPEEFMKELSPLISGTFNTSQDTSQDASQVKPQQTMQQTLQTLSPEEKDKILESSMRTLGMMPQNPMDQIVRSALGYPATTETPSLELMPKLSAKISQQITPPVSQQTAQTVQQKAPQVLTRSQRIARKAELEQQAEQQKAIDIQYKDYISLLDKKGGPAVKMGDWALDKMEKLINTGNLTGAKMYNFRKTMEEHGGAVGTGVGTALGTLGGAIAGLAIPVAGPIAGAMSGAGIGAGLGKAAGELLTPKYVGTKEDQEFTKLAYTFLNGLKDLFGARVAAQEVQMYMDSIPSLSMTDEGKKAVIHDMRIMNKAWRYQKEMKDRIIRDNNGRIPQGLDETVERLTSPYMDELKKQFMGFEMAQAMSKTAQ